MGNGSSSTSYHRQRTVCQWVFSHNYFARQFSHLSRLAGRDFERESWQGERAGAARAELPHADWKRELVAFGTNTDPYQWAGGATS